MSFLQPKPPKAEETPDPSDTANRLMSGKVRKLQAGGRNATFMAQAAQNAAPKPTLTGLGG